MVRKPRMRSGSASHKRADTLSAQTYSSGRSADDSRPTSTRARPLQCPRRISPARAPTVGCHGVDVRCQPAQTRSRSTGQKVAGRQRTISDGVQCPHRFTTVTEAALAAPAPARSLRNRTLLDVSDGQRNVEARDRMTPGLRTTKGLTPPRPEPIHRMTGTVFTSIPGKMQNPLPTQN